MISSSVNADNRHSKCQYVYISISRPEDKSFPVPHLRTSGHFTVFLFDLFYYVSLSGIIGSFLFVGLKGKSSWFCLKMLLSLRGTWSIKASYLKVGYIPYSVPNASGTVSSI